ncbi:MAG: RagB/SusD family nutrient uptake outer membrane protein [Melioribacteraceae bacterium]|nr:RagB/SusD family nutrient uptake outer membrane protein [Melioribacteraceae bacterium]
MKKIKYLLVVLPLVFVGLACTDYIKDVDPLINVVENDRLDTEAQVGFVVKGVQQRFSIVASQLACQADLLSDQMFYTSDVPSASFPSFEEIDKGAITLDNATVATTYRQLGELRFFADDLLARANRISFATPANKDLALFTGNFYGAIARFYSATTFGLTENQPGGIIDAGPFIPASQFLDDAINRYKAALNYTTDAATKRIVNSMLAKAYFAKKDYANAATFAAQGMVSGDKDFQALNSDVSNIYYWGFAGAGRVQIVVADRFNDYLKADPKESARIKISTTTGTSKRVYYWQTKYPEKGTPFQVMTWKENNLMLAECILRGATSGNALSLVNAVRTSYALNALTAVTLNDVLVERDKELFCQGTRLMDQNRTDTWHLAATTWRYMPIPRTERNANPNLPK